MSRVVIKKDWYIQPAKQEPRNSSRLVNLFEQVKITKVEDLPVLMSAKEAARVLKCDPKTASTLMTRQTVQSMKLRGRRAISFSRRFLVSFGAGRQCLVSIHIRTFCEWVTPLCHHLSTRKHHELGSSGGAKNVEDRTKQRQHQKVQTAH